MLTYMNAKMNAKNKCFALAKTRTKEKEVQTQNTIYLFPLE